MARRKPSCEAFRLFAITLAGAAKKWGGDPYRGGEIGLDPAGRLFRFLPMQPLGAAQGNWSANQ